MNNDCMMEQADYHTNARLTLVPMPERTVFPSDFEHPSMAFPLAVWFGSCGGA